MADQKNKTNAENVKKTEDKTKSASKTKTTDKTKTTGKTNSTAKKPVKKTVSTAKKKPTSAKKTSEKKTESKASSADKLLGIKNTKKEGATEKKERIAKDKAISVKPFSKKKKVKKHRVKKLITNINDSIKTAKIQRAKVKLAKKEAPKKREYSPREKKLIKKRVSSLICITIIPALIILGGFKICGALEINGGQAARLDQIYYSEAEVTDYIVNRSMYKTYKKSSSQWQQMLSMYGMTAESFRQQYIEGTLFHDELVNRAAEEEGIEVSDDEVNKHYDNLKAKYGSDANFKKSLEDAGLTEDTYKEQVKQQMTEEALTAKVVTTDPPTDEDVTTYLKSSSTALKDARKGAHILFGEKDKETAQKILDQLLAGTLAWDNAVATYSKDDATKGNGGVMGWDKIDGFSTAINNKISELSPGSIAAELVTDAKGIHIIKCVDKWDTPETVESLDGVPKDIIEYARKEKDKQNKATKLKEWLDKWKEDHGITTEIFPMPKSVPYYVEPKASTTGANSAAGGGATTTTSPDGTTTVNTDGSTATTSDGTSVPITTQ